VDANYKSLLTPITVLADVAGGCCHQNGKLQKLL